ncbi:phage holin family protein [Planosporangium thailandense]|uniref:Phage holin family protein n=1 Tax=Planosporangium thailandense TaxID=765197 RepID=A0ABX0Y4V7_9ACTN|nr:phage holin family protein [Planosporangium thailandense]
MNTAVDTGRVGGTGGRTTRRAASTAALARTVLTQAGRLIRAESRAGWAELRPKARSAGTGAALFGAAGVTVLYGIAALLTAVAALLATVLPVWAAALVVTVALFATAAGVALLGAGRLRRIGSITPERMVESIRLDLRAVTLAARRRHDVRAESTAAPRATYAAVTTAVGSARANPARVRISDGVRRRTGWWAAVGAGVVATGAAVVVLKRRRARRTSRGSAARAWRGVVDRLGR